MLKSKIKSMFPGSSIVVGIFAILFIFISGLALYQNQTDKPDSTLTALLGNVSTDQVNWKESEHKFTEGIYYEFTGTGEKSEAAETRRISHPDLILGYLAGSGVQLREAWYKSYASSCSPPGSDMAMDVIVPAKLLVRVGSPLSKEKQSTLGLSKVESPSIGSCPYNIRHYRFTGSKP